MRVAGGLLQPSLLGYLGVATDLMLAASGVPYWARLGVLLAAWGRVGGGVKAHQVCFLQVSMFFLAFHDE